MLTKTLLSWESRNWNADDDVEDVPQMHFADSYLIWPAISDGWGDFGVVSGWTLDYGTARLHPEPDREPDEDYGNYHSNGKADNPNPLNDVDKLKRLAQIHHDAAHEWRVNGLLFEKSTTLLYADFLEEHDDVESATFLRSMY